MRFLAKFSMQEKYPQHVGHCIAHFDETLACAYKAIKTAASKKHLEEWWRAYRDVAELVLPGQHLDKVLQHWHDREKCTHELGMVVRLKFVGGLYSVIQNTKVSVIIERLINDLNLNIILSEVLRTFFKYVEDTIGRHIYMSLCLHGARPAHEFGVHREQHLRRGQDCSLR
jgi:hypothetical protein